MKSDPLQKAQVLAMAANETATLTARIHIAIPE
jgi:hypothetical protein